MFWFYHEDHDENLGGTKPQPRSFCRDNGQAGYVWPALGKSLLIDSGRSDIGKYGENTRTDPPFSLFAVEFIF
jgi:hypothetical protein